MPVSRLCWNIVFRMGAITSACFFRMYVEIKSGPMVFFGFKSLSSLMMQLVLMTMSSIVVYGDDPFSGMCPARQ